MILSGVNSETKAKTMPTWFLQTQSFLIVALMVYGISQSSNRARHVKCMYTTMAWDIILILQIELSRQAILKASAAMSNPVLLNIHVSLAVTTVVFYVFMFFTGRRVLKGEGKLIPRHRLLGRVTLVLRILTLVTSFVAATPKEIV